MMIRTLAVAAPLALIAASATTVHAASPAPSAGARPTAASAGLPKSLTGEGTLLPWRPGATAITYDTAVVPAGATVRLTITNHAYGSKARLRATGLIPHRAYGAHLHTKPCTAIPDEAGPHFQHHPDPAAVASPPSVNPVYANPRNEVWLDFTADTTGAGAATSAHGWNFHAGHAPRSLILHAEQTRTAPGEAGKAGARAACLSLPTP
jgi:Cu-Zn family superoxide dismutase